MTRSMLLCIIIGALSVVTLISWNSARFIGAEAKPRVQSQLAFLPQPNVAKALTLGHSNSAAKLRWIDSFAYFQHQIDARDDAVVGDQKGGFRRLYETLVALDPHFFPFYEHGAMALSGIVNDQDAALALLMNGVHQHPDEHALWINLLAIMQSSFALDEVHSETLLTYLYMWLNSVKKPEERAVPAYWLSSLHRKQGSEIIMLGYWQQRLANTTKGSAEYDVLEHLLRTQAMRYARTIINEAIVFPGTAETPITTYSLLPSTLLEKRITDYVPLFSPFHKDTLQGVTLRPDPWGMNWEHGHRPFLAVSTGESAVSQHGTTDPTQYWPLLPTQ